MTPSPQSDDGASSDSPESLTDPQSVFRQRSDSAGGSTKKQKVTRSKTACLQCRSRRSRCGALPPNRCPNCVQHGLECTWPLSDGRRKRGRPRKNPIGTDGMSSPRGSSGLTGREGNTSLPPNALPSSVTPPNFLTRTNVDEMPPPLAADTPSSFPSWSIPPIIGPLDFLPQAQDSAQGDLTGNVQITASASMPMISQSHSSVAAYHGQFLPFRHHGRTGTNAGFEHIDVQSQSELLPIGSTLSLDPRGLPNPMVIQNILDLYFTHFAERFPFIVRSDLYKGAPQFPFVFHCIGALVSRFSDLPEISMGQSPRQGYGAIFHEQARRELGTMLSIPSRETVLGLLLLVEAAFGSGSRTEMWTLMGMAVRMTLDTTSHMKKPAHFEISENDERLDRLMFWSVLIMDYSLAFAEGRKTSISGEDILQELPREDDMPPRQTVSGLSDDGSELRSPFPFAAEMIVTFGPAIDIFNSMAADQNDIVRGESIRQLRSRVAAQYDELPLDMTWNAANLQKHHRAGHGPMYLFLHLWNHTIQCSRYLYDPGREKESPSSFGPTGKTDQITLQSIQAGSWLHCARFIGDMLVLADVIDARMFLAVPSLNHCFFVAGQCFIEDLGARLGSEVGQNPEPEDGSPAQKKATLSRTLFKAIAIDNIKSLKQGLTKQSEFWDGVKQVLSIFDSRFEVVRGVNAPKAGSGSAVNLLPFLEAPHDLGLDWTTGGLEGQTAMDGARERVTSRNIGDASALIASLYSPGGLPLWNTGQQMATSPTDLLRLLGLEMG